jgi:hypothetical protein
LEPHSHQTLFACSMGSHFCPSLQKSTPKICSRYEICLSFILGNLYLVWLHLALCNALKTHCHPVSAALVTTLN